MRRLIALALPFGATARRLRRDRKGLALIEFAFVLPLLLVLSLTGAELTNYIVTRMRVSQLSLHIADNASRIGSGSRLAAKTITESDINDLLVGAGLQAGEMDLFGRGRVIISSIVPKSEPNPSGHYVINWQRCAGQKTTHESSYGDQGDQVTNGMGRAGREAFAPVGGSTIFVEVYYEYQPLVSGDLAPNLNFTEIASMIVRDRRDESRIYNNENAPVATC